MRRIVFTSLLSLMLLVPLTGCGLFGKKKNKQVSADEYPTTVYQEPVGGTASTYQTTPSYDTYAAPAGGASNGYATTAAYPTSTGMGGGRSYVVKKKDTLYSIARSEYGEAGKWRDIYEANRTELGGDPNRIRVGQRLTLP